MRSTACFGLALGALALALAACAPDLELVDTASQAILGGGHDAGYGSVAVLVYGNGHQCTAVLVHERFALTSADCVKDETVANMRLLFMGAQNRADLPLLRAHVATATVDPTWDAATGAHAIAVLELTEAVPETVARPQAILAGALDASLVGQSITAVGTGRDRPIGQGSLSGYRISVTSTVASLDSDGFVWGGDVQGSCFGDAGGPVLQAVDGRDTVIGLILGGPTGCGETLAARVDVQRDFIVATTRGALVPGTGALGADAGFGPPDAAPAAPDGGARPDAGSAPATDDGGGCGCQVSRGGAPRAGALLLLMGLCGLGLVFGRPARRRSAR